MNKYFYRLKTEHGFISPYILFVITLLIIIVYHQLHLYTLNQEIVVKQLEQYRIQTMYRSAIHTIHITEEIEFNKTMPLPNGNISINYVATEANKTIYSIQIITKEGSQIEKIYHLYSP
ncbi:hypothetical protein ACFOZ1_12110 [Gracilibacillus marinus]|jgi:hypothetical protein|uniref:Competence protein ComG n=1 Tax=Gracilibacillus marinus TaxID=630535 RepID=A0ABV8VWJ3_9BACI